MYVAIHCCILYHAADKLTSALLGITGGPQSTTSYIDDREKYTEAETAVASTIIIMSVIVVKIVPERMCPLLH